MKLEEFLRNGSVRSAFLDPYEPEWKHLYIRRGIVSVNRLDDDHFILLEDVVVIASLEAETPRTGTFTRLVDRIESTVPGVPIMIENLTDPDFGEKLTEVGFEEMYIGEKPLSPTSGRHFLKRTLLVGHEVVFPLRRLTSAPNEETMRLARRAVKHRFDPRKLPPKKLNEWLNRISRDLANAGEAEYGPAYKKRYK